MFHYHSLLMSSFHKSGYMTKLKAHMSSQSNRFPERTNSGTNTLGACSDQFMTKSHFTLISITSVNVISSLQSTKPMILHGTTDQANFFHIVTLPMSNFFIVPRRFPLQTNTYQLRFLSKRNVYQHVSTKKVSM